MPLSRSRWALALSARRSPAPYSRGWPASRRCRSCRCRRCRRSGWGRCRAAVSWSCSADAKPSSARVHAPASGRRSSKPRSAAPFRLDKVGSRSAASTRRPNGRRGRRASSCGLAQRTEALPGVEVSSARSARRRPPRRAPAHSRLVVVERMRQRNQDRRPADDRQLGDRRGPGAANHQMRCGHARRQVREERRDSALMPAARRLPRTALDVLCARLLHDREPRAHVAGKRPSAAGTSSEKKRAPWLPPNTSRRDRPAGLRRGDRAAPRPRSRRARTGLPV